MPGGKLDFGDSFKGGAARELKGETGMTAVEMEVVCVNNERTETAHYVTVGLLCEKFEGEPKILEPDEITEWGWFDLDKLPSLMYPSSVKILRNYKEKKFFIDQ